MKVISNKRKRHFTIYKNGAKFRTLPMSKDEFEEMAYNTINDWQDFLRTQIGSYYKVRSKK